MTVTLVLPEGIALELERAASDLLETAGVLIAGVVESPDGEVRLLGQEIVWVGDGAYLDRQHDRMTITSDGYVTALGEAARRNAMAIWVHTHPGPDSVPTPSPYDTQVDEEISDLFRLRTGSPYYATVIVSPRTDGITFSGRLHDAKMQVFPIDRLWRVGAGWQLSRAFDSQWPQISAIFDRSVRAFGSLIQGTLNDLRIGIVGCGGTGSAVAEQLVRLGIRNLKLVDVDVLSESNVTRVYGSTPSDVDALKVDVLRAHLLRIAPDLNCKPVATMITMEEGAHELTTCDLVFGCTDDNAGRLVLSKLATYLITPVIDIGVLLSSDSDEKLIGIDGRVTVLTPGAACLVCRDRVDLARAAAELMTPEERRRLADEGYAPALGGVEPAVVAFTTAVAAAAVSELLERLIGYGPSPRPSEILLRWHEREISTNVAHPRIGHYCHPDAKKNGYGAVSPFLDQIWPEK